MSLFPFVWIWAALFLMSMHSVSIVEAVNLWDQPVFPSSLENMDFEIGKKDGIPKKVWVGRRKKPISDSELPEYLQKLFERARADGWEPSVMSNEDQLAFMEEYWPGTSTLWAFKVINPRLGNAACDIWRYALLYAVGGLYLDDDSYLEMSLNKIVNEGDTLIVTAEKNQYRDNCFMREFHLSEARNCQKKYPEYNNQWNQIAGGKMLASWGIFAAPYHPIIREVISNIVAVIRAEYLRAPLVFMMNTEPRWKIVMCTTGPTMFSATIRNYFAVAASNKSSGFIDPPPIRFISNDYHEFGGIFKVDTFHNGRYPVSDNHYMIAMAKHSITLLREYVPFETKCYEGKVVTPGGKKIYWVQNQTLHMFPNYDTITFNGFDVSDIQYIQDWDDFQKFPEGEGVPPCEPNTPNCRRRRRLHR